MADLTARFEIEAGLAADLAAENRPLADRLAEMLAANPTDPQIPDSYWQELEERNRNLLAIWLLIAWQTSGRRHGWGFEAAKQAGLGWADRRSADVSRKFVDHSRTMVDTAVRDWRNRQASQPTEQPTPSTPAARKFEIDQAEIDERVKKILGPDRVTGVAVTETSNAITDASEAAMEDQGLKTDLDTWYTEGDQKVCPICGPLHGQPRDVWQERFDAGPPAHPNCRCWIKYDNEPGDPDLPTGDHGVSTQGFVGAFRP